MSRRRVVIETSCLSVHRDRLERTGIQEVQFRLLLELERLRRLRPDLELLAAPLPGPFPQAVPQVVELLQSATGRSSVDLWGHDLAARGQTLTEEEVVELWSSADVLHVQTISLQLDTLLARVAARERRPRVSVTVFDVIPLIFPEYFLPDLQLAFARFADAVRRHADLVVGISRHTALDALEHLTDGGDRPGVAYVTLPTGAAPTSRDAGRGRRLLAGLGLTAGEYVVVVGSVEPRKGLERLLEGFERYLARPDARPLRLALVGGGGWKNRRIRGRLEASSAAASVVRCGYLSDEDLAELVGASLTVAMLSMYEGFGIPAAQASAAGLLPLVSAGSSLPEAAPGRCVQVDPWDPESVAVGLDLVVRARGTGSPPDHDWSRYAEELLEVIAPR